MSAYLGAKCTPATGFCLTIHVALPSCVPTQPDRREDRLCVPFADSRTHRGRRAYRIEITEQALPMRDTRVSGSQTAPAVPMLVTRCTAEVCLSCRASR